MVTNDEIVGFHHSGRGGFVNGDIHETDNESLDYLRYFGLLA